MMLQDGNNIPIPPTDLRTVATEFSIYGSGRPIHAVIKASKNINNHSLTFRR